DLSRALARMQQEIRRTTNKQIEYEKMYALGELSAGIAHEIRNPLFAVRNNLDYLERHFSQSPDQQEIYGEMKYGLFRMSRVINAVLDFAKPHEMELESHDFQEVLQHTMALLQKQLQKEKVTVQIDLNPEMPPVEMDFHRMEQVLVNLVTNAKNALDGKPGTIIIQGTGTDRQIVVTIEDNGPGIPGEDLKYIFDPFFTGSKNGTGLGLTIVRRIIEQHHGTISVESKPGEGTRFTITLPARQGSITNVSL
ncbi:MAG: ATP-binding protein, partial [Calditrichota bacterium]